MDRKVALESLDARDARGWREWLGKHHQDREGVLLVFHKGSKSSITYDEALDEALAYGWIDSVLAEDIGVSPLERFNAGQVGTPKGFEAALKKDRKAWANYQRMAPSHRKRYFMWIAGAKRQETREKRIAEAVQFIAQNVKDLLK